ncbi:hypothetical protein KIN20_001779 [Parelaphostrongylus tenuis]|uniref:Uncharacterized protein n=1 Tax=Parelaphostrongylus tenuis TaxID=148309 RepID=A0AAD5LU67_PARTN|nr:hypothetical protein KIN20_001779 [Parelaphostrongylus tenuis]
MRTAPPTFWISAKNLKLNRDDEWPVITRDDAMSQIHHESETVILLVHSNGLPYQSGDVNTTTKRCRGMLVELILLKVLEVAKLRSSIVIAKKRWNGGRTSTFLLIIPKERVRSGKLRPKNEWPASRRKDFSND